MPLGVVVWMCMLLWGCQVAPRPAFEVSEVRAMQCDGTRMRVGYGMHQPLWRLPRGERSSTALDAEIAGAQRRGRWDCGTVDDRSMDSDFCEKFWGIYEKGTGQWCCGQSGGSLVGYRHTGGERYVAICR